jgi:hypothetical protein
MNNDTVVLLGTLMFFGIIIGFLPGKNFEEREVCIYAVGAIGMLCLAGYAYYRVPKLALLISGVCLSWIAGGIIGWFRRRKY